MRIHDLEAAEWREAAGGYHKKSIASDVALVDIGNDAELRLEGDGEHLIVVLNGSGKVAAGSRGAFLSGGICLGLASSEQVTLRPDAEEGLLLMHVRLSREAAESLFTAIPERSDGWEIEPQPAATAAPEAPVELAPTPKQEDSAGSWEDGDDFDDERRQVAAAAPAVREAEEVVEASPAGEGAGDDAADVDDVYDDDEEDEDEDREDDGDAAGDGAEEPAAKEGALAAAAAHATTDTPWYASNHSTGTFGLLPRGLIHRTESGELVLNGRAIHAGQNLSVYHRRRWVQARVRGENGRWHVVVASQHVPLVPGMRARQDI